MADIKNDATLVASLISYWKLDETTGTRVDAHASNDLTQINTVTSATGIINNGADFEASNFEYLTITDAAQSGLDISGDHFVSFWASAESLPATNTQRIIYGKFASSGNQRAYSLRYRNQGGSPRMIFLINDNGSSSEDYNFAYTMGTSLKHYVWSWDSALSRGTLYVDGVSQGNQSGSKTSIHNSSAGFKIGQTDNLGGNEYWDGVVDEFGIWSRTATTTDVSKLYNSGAGLPYEDAGAGGSTFTPIVTAF